MRGWDELGHNYLGWEILRHPLLCDVQHPEVTVCGSALQWRREGEGA